MRCFGVPVSYGSWRHLNALSGERKKMDDRLELLLKQITDGKLRFRAAGKSLADIESFQRTVRDLHELEANGYIDILDERSEFHTGALLVDLVFVRKR